MPLDLDEAADVTRLTTRELRRLLRGVDVPEVEPSVFEREERAEQLTPEELERRRENEEFARRWAAAHEPGYAAGRKESAADYF